MPNVDEIYQWDKVGRWRIDRLMSSEIRASLEHELIVLEPFIPDWCTHVFVFFVDDLPTKLTMKAEYDYRRGTLRVGPNYLMVADNRLVALAHEVIHIYLEPLQNTIRDIHTRLVDHEPALEKLTGELIRHALEQSVCDLSHVLMAALEKKDGT